MVVRRIGTQAYLAMLASGMVPLLALLGTVGLLHRIYVQDTAYAQAQLRAGELAQQLSGILQETRQTALAFARNPGLASSAASPRERQVEIEKMASLSDSIEHAVLLDGSGRVLASTMGSESPAILVRDAFARALSGNLVILPPAEQRSKARMHMLIKAPVRNESGTPIRVLCLLVPFDRIQATVLNARVGMGGRFVLASEDGSILADSGLHLLTANFLDYYQTENNEWHIQGLVKGRDGKRFLGTMREIPIAREQAWQPASWRLISLQPQEEIIALVQDFQQMLLYAMVLGLVLTIALGHWLARGIARPVIAADVAARRAASGNYQVAVPVEGPRELQGLATSFNAMMEEVKNQQCALESTVRERTETLVQSQQTLAETMALLRASFEATEQALLILDAEGVVLSANQRVIQMFALSEEPLDGQNAEQIWDLLENRFADAGDVEGRWHFFMRHVAAVGSEEWQLAEPNHRVLAVYTAPVHDEQHRIVGRLWSFMDITEKRHMEHGLQQAQKMEAVGHLAGGVAHDFNNLLTTILGNLDLAAVEYDLEEGLGETLSEVRRAGERGARLVKQLLGFSRRGMLQMESCNIGSIVMEIVSLLERTIDPRIVIQMSLRDDLWSVVADTGQMHQVIMNMCINACDAMPDGGQLMISTGNHRVEETTVEGWQDIHAGEHVCIEIRDNGTGMPQQVQERIFEPFFTTKQPGKGTGLGLAMSFGIIKQHRGSILCESAPGEGTCFHVLLPRQVSYVPDHTEVVPPDAVGGTETILVIDDEPPVRLIAESILKRKGYRLISSSGGRKGVEICSDPSISIDLVLLDYTMPEISGRDAFKAIRAVRPDLPVVFCSGYPLDMDAIEREVGSRPDGFVQKPYHRETLAASMRKVLDRMCNENADELPERLMA